MYLQNNIIMSWKSAKKYTLIGKLGQSYQTIIQYSYGKQKFLINVKKLRHLDSDWFKGDTK